VLTLFSSDSSSMGLAVMVSHHSLIHTDSDATTINEDNAVNNDKMELSVPWMIGFHDSSPLFKGANGTERPRIKSTALEPVMQESSLREWRKAMFTIVAFLETSF